MVENVGSPLCATLCPVGLCSVLRQRNAGEVLAPSNSREDHDNLYRNAAITPGLVCVQSEPGKARYPQTSTWTQKPQTVPDQLMNESSSAAVR